MVKVLQGARREFPMRGKKYCENDLFGVTVESIIFQRDFLFFLFFLFLVQPCLLSVDSAGKKRMVKML